MAKEPMITVRVTPEQHQAFKIACAALGKSMSQLLRDHIDLIIRIEDDAVAEALGKAARQQQGGEEG